MQLSTLDPLSDLTPQQRREQVAAILAHGLLRTLRQARNSADFDAKTLEFSAAGLDVPGETRLSVSRVPEVNRTTNQRGIR
ncbi:MAG: hypothetical protein ACYC0X_31465 [Pirellulaceae bacterium]